MFYGKALLYFFSFALESKYVRFHSIDPGIWTTNLKDVVALGVEDHDTLVEVVVLHRRRGVEDGQRGLDLRLEGVVGAAVVQVVAEASHQQPEDLKRKDSFWSPDLSHLALISWGRDVNGAIVVVGTQRHEFEPNTTNSF